MANVGARRTPAAGRNTLAEFSLGSLLDMACTELAARPRSKPARRIIVHPSVYRCVADAHRHQSANRLPLMLLGLELQQSDLTPPGSFRITE